MSASIEEHLDCYFSSLNPITRKICNELQNIRRAYGETDWDNLDPAEQEEVLAKYMISDEVRSKYANLPRDEMPEMYPKMKINCGEKIVVDFENDDGWTWQDEHSGPFSWMTRSQQDLTLDSLDNLDDQIKKYKRGKSHSPDREGAGKRQWDTYDKGTGTNMEAANTADEIFQKFGIAFSFGKDQGTNEDFDESKLLAEGSEQVSDQCENVALIADSDANDYCEHNSGFDSSVKGDNLRDSLSCSDFSTQPSSTLSSNSSKKRKEFGTHKSLSKSDIQLGLMDDLLDFDSSYGGQVSPVYVEDPGESSTDPEQSFSPTRFSYSNVDVQFDSPSVLVDTVSVSQSDVIRTQPTALHSLDVSEQDWGNSILDDDTLEQRPAAVTTPVRTGFDFLDNW